MRMKQIFKKITNLISNHKKISCVILCLILFLTFLPVMLKYGAVYILKKNGADTVSIKDIDLNLFTGNLKIENLSLKGKDTEALNLPLLTSNISMLQLLLGRICVESIYISELEITIENKKNVIVIGLSVPKGPSEQIVIEKETGKKPTEEENEQKGLAFGIRTFEISNSIIKYKDEKLSTRLDINKITIHDLYSWKKNNETTIKIDTRLNGSPLLAKIKVKPFADVKSVKIDIRLDHLALQDFAAYTTDHIDGFEGLLDMDLNLSVLVDQSNAIDLKQSGSVSVSKIKCRPLNIPINMKINETGFSYNGTSHVKLPAAGKFPFLEINGTLSNDLLHVELGNRKAVIRHNGLKWAGDITNSTGEAEKTEVSGRIELAELTVDGDTKNIHILTLDKLNLEDLLIKGAERISVGEFSTAGLSVAQPAAEIAGVKSITPYTNGNITIRDIQLNNMNSLHIQSVDIADTTFFLQKTSANELPLINAMNRFITNIQTLTKKQEDEKEVADAPLATVTDSIPTATVENGTGKKQAEKFTIAIGAIAFTGKNTVEISDKSVKPSFTKHIDIETLSLKDINNDNINNAARLDVLLKSGRHASIGVSGTVMPFHPKVNLDLKGEIKTLHLVDLSPYIASKIGYNIKTGALSADIICKIESDELHIKNKLFLENIELIPDEENQINQVVKQISMPLDQVLSILRDKNNNVTLTIPVTGNINNPDFNMNDIYKKAMAKAAKSAAISIVKNLLQPYGTLITIAQLAHEGGKYVTKIRLDPLEFPPGSFELDQNGKSYLNNVAKLLNEKPELRLSLCGFSTPVDVEGMDFSVNPDPFIDIAKKRHENAIIYLESQGVSHERLFNCNATIDTDEEAKPRVEMSI